VCASPYAYIYIYIYTLILCCDGVVIVYDVCARACLCE